MFALVDCNNFYASCERVFNPALNGKPVVILSNNDGCIVARSNEAKALEIPMGCPLFQAKHIINKHRVQVFSSNYALYGDMSQRVMNTLSTFTPNIEYYSVDEAFLGFEGFEHQNLKKISKRIHKTVWRHVGIPVSVGMAPTKTLAKIANYYAKKDKRRKHVCILDTDQKVELALKHFPIGEVWGVGRQIERLLEKHGVQTAFDFTQLPQSWVRKHLTVVGERMQQELRGIPCIELEERPPAKKAICTSRSFGKMQTDFDPIHEAITTHAVRCAEKLRAQGTCANLITVFLHTNPNRRDLLQYRGGKTLALLTASDSGIEIAKAATQLLRMIYQRGYYYKKAGVIVGGIVPNGQVQTSLFGQEEQEKQQRVFQAVDQLNNKLGRDKVRIAAQGYQQSWNHKRNKLSPSYTTCWKDIIKVKAG